MGFPFEPDTEEIQRRYRGDTEEIQSTDLRATCPNMGPKDREQFF